MEDRLRVSSVIISVLLLVDSKCQLATSDVRRISAVQTYRDIVTFQKQTKNKMSNLRKGARRVVRTIAVLTAVSTVLSLSGFAVLAPNWASAAAPSDYGLKEGDLISAAGSDDPDVYIVNEMGYKRLFLNPAIFGLYGHLGGFAAVKSVSPATRDAFPTSGLFRVDGDEKVYGLEKTGEDAGGRRWGNNLGAQAGAE